MAIYFNLGIDCGSEEAMADVALRHFKDFLVDLPGLLPAGCKVWKVEARGRWFVGVWPEGLGYGTLPTCRPELVREPNLERIRNALYAKLSELRGYRRALFGGEAYEVLACATPEDDDDIDYADMVFRIEEFPTPATGLSVGTFSAGYAIVKNE